ncbi:MAG: hypothetical protein WCF48_10375 [Terriglobales bacterium]
MAGHEDAATPISTLQSPSAVTTDSNHHIFVADSAAHVVHVFDFTHSNYFVLEKGRDRFGVPVSLAVDGHNNLYVVDEIAGTVVVYDPAGKFQEHFWTMRRGEASLDSPAGIAIDKTTGHVYICDKQHHMIIMADARGRPISTIGRRGGGYQSGEFKFPSQLVVEHGELIVLDTGNTRIQILDTDGKFRREIDLAYADNRTGLAVDAQKNIYVSNPILDQIEVFGHSGEQLYTFDLSTITGANFIRPSGLWVDQGYCLYVVDSQSNRIGLFQISGQNAQRCQ